MSKIAELAYDIQELYIEGHNPRMIAVMLECPIEMVYDWIEDQSLTVDEEDTSIEFPDAYPFADELSPFATSNS